MKKRLVTNPIFVMILVIALITSLGTTVLSGIALAASSTTADTATTSAPADTTVVAPAADPVAETPVVTDPVVESVAPVAETAPATTPVVDPVVEAPAPVAVETAPVAPAADVTVTSPAKTEVSAPVVNSAVVAVYDPAPCTLAITSVSVTPSSGVADDSISVSGTYSGIAEGGKVIWMTSATTGTIIGSLSVGSGSFSASANVPSDATAGTHTVRVTIEGGLCQNRSDATFMVETPSEPPVDNPTDPVTPPVDNPTAAVPAASTQTSTTVDTTPADQGVVASSVPVTGVNLAILMIYALAFGTAGVLALWRFRPKHVKR